MRVTVDGFDVVVLAAPVRLAEAERAIALAGGRVLLTLDWAQADMLAARSFGRPVLLLEAEGVAPAVLSAGLPHVARVAEMLDLQVVATLAAPQIDEMAAMLMGSRAELLCDPTIADVVAALAVARQIAGDGRVPDRWREGDAERLRKVNEEVARIAELLARLANRGAEDGGGGSPGDVGDRHVAFGFAPPSTDGDPHAVRQAIRARRMRDAFFGENLFEDPAWDMLLDLYAARLEGTRVSVSSLCIAAAVAPTTALRWIGKLTEADLFDREPDPADRRRAFMVLSSKALRGMQGYVAATRRAGLSIA